jgi:hypothetical protein
MYDDEIDDGIVTNILASLITCFLIGIEREMPPHSRKARLIFKVEEAIVNLKRSTELQLNDRHNEIGVKLYNKLTEEFQRLLEEDIPNEHGIILAELQG